MGYVLKHGTIIGENTRLEQVDVLVEGNRIKQIGIDIDSTGHTLIDCTNLFISPGFIDMHVHLREPGFEYKETIESGSKAAAAGGFTTVACMPNTRPATDNADIVRFIIEQANKHGYARVLPIAAITAGQKGEELTDIPALKEAGAVGLSDDGRGVQRADRMKRAMEIAKQYDMPLIIHAEDETLSGKGCMNAGEAAERLGLPGIPDDAEAVMVARDIVLAEVTGAHLHVCHVSAKSVIELIRYAKGRGLPVTGEVAPHHLLLTDDQIDPDNSDWKVNPPLRTKRDREACIEAFLDGTLDIVATDHAPHSVEEKQKPFTEAPFGMVGLEIAFPLMYTHFVKTGRMTLNELVDRMATRPAKLFKLQGGRIQPGEPADLTVLDLHATKVIDPASFLSKGKNTPFAGQKAQGWPVLTMVDGVVSFDAR
ncbi:dihydroorotase [Fodinisporobacter ferrooxydans]|uniref:Dihydroorotase n=1 Tax=Fodinisporobacter ferrooxydans TaxID=2901836 RepID=A0ABY4CIB0_9BACL|nr:dihydroorotase [Alicyclobacillaceae bacterium MYW30-H2]